MSSYVSNDSLVPQVNKKWEWRFSVTDRFFMTNYDAIYVGKNADIIVYAPLIKRRYLSVGPLPLPFLLPVCLFEDDYICGSKNLTINITYARMKESANSVAPKVTIRLENNKQMFPMVKKERKSNGMNNYTYKFNLEMEQVKTFELNFHDNGYVKNIPSLRFERQKNIDFCVLIESAQTSKYGL